MTPLSPFSQAGLHLGCAFRHFGKATAALWMVSDFRALMILLAVFVALMLTGCGTLRKTGAVRVGNAIATNALNAEVPASVTTNDTTTTTTVQPGARITAPMKTGTSPVEFFQAVLELPAFTVSTVSRKVDAVASNERAPDRSVELRKADNAERRILLYAAIAAALLGGIARAMLPQWPSLSTSLWLAAALSGAAWKFAEVPWWAALVALCVSALLIAGYKRAEWDKNQNGIPDFLEKNTPSKDAN